MASSYRGRFNAEPKRKPAKHALNQEGLDRLWERYDKFSQNPESKMLYTIRKAIKSLQACQDAITTNKEAKALHGVGDALARVIVKTSKDANNAERNKTKLSSLAEVTNMNTTTTATGMRKRKQPPPPPVAKDCKIEAPILSEKQKAYNKAVSDSKSLSLPKDNWKVVLLVDGREHHSKRVIAKLQMSGIPSEERHLPIGDMAWVAKSGATEVMLGTIVERKEVHDLASSLFGTRYKEQRLRLQNCGLPQVFLLVEGNTKDVSNCPHDTLQMAMMETRIELGFQVVQTRHLEDTIRFLKSVHRRILQRAFPSAFGETVATSLPTFSSPNTHRKRRKRRRSIKKRSKNDRRSFEEMVFDNPPEPALGTSRFISYQELKCKVEKDREEGTKTIKAIFCGMLKQIPKVSNATVQTLSQAYPTPDALFRALDGLNISEAKNLLSDLGADSKKVGEQKALQVCYAFMAGENDETVLQHSSQTAECVAAVKNSKNRAEKPCGKTKKTEHSSQIAKRRKEIDFLNAGSTFDKSKGVMSASDAHIAKPSDKNLRSNLSKTDSWDDLWQTLEEENQPDHPNVRRSRPGDSKFDSKKQAKEVAGADVVDLMESDEETIQPAMYRTLTPNAVEKEGRRLKSDRKVKTCYAANDLSVDNSDDESVIKNTSTQQNHLLKDDKESRLMPKQQKSAQSLDISMDELPTTTQRNERKCKDSSKSKRFAEQRKINNLLLSVEDSEDDSFIAQTATKQREGRASESSVSSWDVTPFVVRRRQQQHADTELCMDDSAMRCDIQEADYENDNPNDRLKNRSQHRKEERSTENNTLLNGVSMRRDIQPSLSSETRKPGPSPASEKSISSYDTMLLVEQRNCYQVQDSAIDALLSGNRAFASPKLAVAREVSIPEDECNALAPTRKQEVIELLD